MTQEKPSAAVRVQFILFGLLLFVFFIWASRKCTRSHADIDEKRTDATEVQVLRDSLAQRGTVFPEKEKVTTPKTDDILRRDTIKGTKMQIIRERIVPLYVTIEGLALREGPGLSKKIFSRLKLYEEVSFMNEVTDSLYTIKLGNTTPTEPWVKVRSRKGKTGWVYGAGVDFYKRKLEGVE